MSKLLTKVNSLGSNSGPLIALPSPYAHLETGPRMCPPEKSLGNDCIRCRGVRSPQSGLSGNNREIRALFAYLGAERAEFLCSPDCVAEGEGFEPPVPFQAQRFSRPPVSTTHTSLRRLTHRNIPRNSLQQHFSGRSSALFAQGSWLFARNSGMMPSVSSVA